MTERGIRDGDGAGTGGPPAPHSPYLLRGGRHPAAARGGSCCLLVVRSLSPPDSHLPPVVEAGERGRNPGAFCGWRGGSSPREGMSRSPLPSSARPETGCWGCLGRVLISRGCVPAFLNLVDSAGSEEAFHRSKWARML